MSRPGSSSKGSSTERAIANPTVADAGRSARSALWSVLRFGLCTAALSLLLGLLVTPFIRLSWVQVVRRCVSVAAVASLWLCASALERRSVRSYGLPSLRVGKPHLLGGIALGIAGLGLMLAIGLVSGTCEIDINPDASRLWRTVIGFIPAAIVVGMMEELIFRGFILQHLLSVSRPFAVLSSSALYALAHLKQRSLTTEGWMELTGLFLLGLVLAASYLQTGYLWMGIGLHAALAYGARINKLVIAFSDTSMSWLVGTSRLVNGLSAWVALTGIGAVIWWWTQWVRQRGGTCHVDR